MQKIFNFIFEVVIYNFLFLILNAIWFQCFYTLNFELKYFIIFFVSSVSIFPSVFLMWKTVFNRNFKGNEISIFLAIWNEIKAFKFVEILYLMMLHLLTSLFIFNIYILEVDNFVKLILFVSNFLCLILTLCLYVNFIFHSCKLSERELVKRSFLIRKEDISVIIKGILLVLFMGIFTYSNIPGTIYFSFGLMFRTIIGYMKWRLYPWNFK